MDESQDQNMFEPHDDSESQTPTDETATEAPPPPHGVEDRLVRDPSATLGGVLSGIGHRYGWDVSFVRLAFVLLLLFTAGSAVVAYLLAWLIIPRATMWPPVGPSGRPRRIDGFSSRDIGFGLIGLAVLVVIGVGSGRAAAIVVPLALIAAGVWMLVQSPRSNLAVAGASGTAGATGTAGGEAGFEAPRVGDHTDQPAPTPLSPPVAQTVIQQPVVPRSRGRRAAKFGLVGLVGFLLLALIAIPLVFFAVVFEGEIDFDATSRRVVVENEFPSEINQDVGELIVDLREFDFPDEPTTPEMLDITVDAGDVEVFIPEGIRVQVQASADVGDVTVFEQNDEGLNPQVVVNEPDPHLILNVDLDLGEVDVVRDDDVVRRRSVEIEERS